jgi:predicted GH43/DUF377 family glycosyl hydrolase
MKWVKKGFIFKPSGEFEWMKEYAQVPTPLIHKDILRIYFTTRPAPVNNLYRSQTGYIEVEMENPNRILTISNKPVLQHGELGSFDEFGIMPGSFIKIGNGLAMYYTGWSREQSVPYTTSIGLALSYDNGKTFTRISNGPIISKNINDPFLVNGPFVLYEKGIYHMWYSSSYTWLSNGDRKDPIYKIKHASSEDGINWNTSKEFIIEEKIQNEAQNAPCVFIHDEKYFMIFCYRQSVNFRNSQNGYKIGLAVSEDNVNWQRLNDPIFTGEEEEWDLYMKAYPRVIKVNDKYFLFYNGNYFGKDGFGYAELEF